jgi:hypothetical protein
MKLQEIPGIWFSLSGVLYAAGVVACMLAAPWSFTVGFALAGALVLLNAWLGARRVRRAEFPYRNRVIASLLGGFYVRLAVMGICLFLMLRFLQADPLGLVTGLSVVPAGLFVMVILMYVANRRPEEV